MRTEFTEFDVWSFQKADPDTWTWRRTSPDGEVLIEAHTPFSSLADCLEDARRHGYTGSFSLTA
jgi:hypothetical protein